MASAALLHIPAPLNGNAALAEESPLNGNAVLAEESGLVDYQPGSKVVKNLGKKTLSESPVETYADAEQVPSEFVVKDTTRASTRAWGDVDASHLGLDFQLPFIDMSPLIARGATDQAERVDIDEEGAKEVVAEIGRACETWGFFQAVNHGIPENLLDRVMEVTDEFFRLPLEEKQKCAVEPGGFEGYGRLDYLWEPRQWSDCLRHTIRPKSTLATDCMPENPSSYKAMIEEYTQEVEKLLHVLLTSLSEYLGLESGALLQKAQQEDTPRLILRVNYYPKCPEPEAVFGLVGHKDFGTISVLVQDEVGGLQVQKPGTDVWVNVKPMKGSLVINIANQVEILSNGRFNSAMHRAVVNRNKPRLSIVAFATPGYKCVIRPLHELLEKTGELPRYKELIYGDYLPNLLADSKKGILPHVRYEINRN